jgi:putative PIN family toxin of toxin-antitoxin system
MKIVLDTNILVAGLLSPFGPCGEIVRMVSSGKVALSVDARILSEYDEVLHRSKFRFDKDHVAALLDHIECSGHKVASSPLPHTLPDPDDESFLEVAIAGHVVCLVTGNQIRFPPKLCMVVKVLSPNQFISFYKKQRRRVT